MDLTTGVVMDWKEHDIRYNFQRTRQRYFVYKKAYGNDDTDDARMVVNNVLGGYEYWCDKVESILGTDEYLRLLKTPVPLIPL